MNPGSDNKSEIQIPHSEIKMNRFAVATNHL
jgi:hypothetical protein